jgi:hypothetical protein
VILGLQTPELITGREQRFMAPTLSELRKMSDEALIAEHDQAARSAQLGVAYYLDELSRRDQTKQTQAMLAHTETMLDYTRWIAWLTAAVTIATIINIGVLFVRR